MASVDDFGAIGDNVTDDGAAINAALAISRDVTLSDGKIYFTSRAIEFQLNGQRLAGLGSIRSTANAAILATALDGLEMIGIGIIHQPTVNSVDAIVFRDCTDGRVERCRISGHRQTGIRITGSSTRCSIHQNRFIGMSPDSRWGVPSGADIGIDTNATYCEVTNNFHMSGGATAIQIRNYRGGQVQHCDHHVVSGNIISGYNSYGIVLYRDGPYDLTDPNNILPNPSGEPDLSVYGCTVIGNNIRNISGDRPNSPGGSDYIFGCGIYVQGAEHTTVTGNIVSNTHSAGLVVSQLAPGAIGAANVADVQIVGNNCDTDAHAGIYINDQNGLGGLSGGSIVISGNSLVRMKKYGIYGNSRSNILINSNIIDGGQSYVGVAQSRILAKTYTQSGIRIDRGNSANNLIDNIAISDNTFNNISGTGVYTEWCSNVRILHNKIIMGSQNDDGNPVQAGDGINIRNGSDFQIEGNRINNYLRGVVINSTISGDNKFVDNFLTGQGVASNGLIVNAPCWQINNVIGGHTASDIGGTYADGRTLVNSSNPDVRATSYAVVSPPIATTITDFVSGVVGQVLTVRAANANATIASNGSLLLAGAFPMSVNSSLTIRKISAGEWIEIGRKI